METGQQMNVLTGEISENNAKGAYGFLHLPHGDFAVRFETGSAVDLEQYTVTQPNVGTNDTIDSDAIAVVKDEKLAAAGIEGIQMPEAKWITVQTYESRHHDLGLYGRQVDIPVKKVWDDADDQDGIRPEQVTVALWANGEATDKILTLTEAGGWTGSFTNLPEYENGQKIVYTVQEASVTGYTSAITGTASEGFTITNTHTPDPGPDPTPDPGPDPDPKPETGSLTVSKTVSGSRGSKTREFTFTVTLGDASVNGEYGEMTFHDGEAVFTLKHGESKTATGLPAGIRYAAAFHNYRGGSGGGGGGSSGSHVNVTVRKEWKLEHGKTAAEFVTAVLRRDGIPYDTVRLSSQNGWTHVWYGLEESHVWTVEEMEVPEGFSAAVYQQGTRFAIVNSDVPEGEAEIQWEEPNFAQMEEVSENREIHTSNVPKTGDRSGVMLWAALLAISGAGFAGVWILDRRRRRKEKHRE